MVGHPWELRNTRDSISSQLSTEQSRARNRTADRASEPRYRPSTAAVATSDAHTSQTERGPIHRRVLSTPRPPLTTRVCSFGTHALTERARDLVETEHKNVENTAA